MHIHYILLAHRNPAQVGRLVRSLDTPNTSFYIHIDKKVDWQPFREALPGMEKIHWLQDRQLCIWGDSSIVKATLAALRVIVAEKKPGYCVLLSGQDYPLRANSQIEAYLQKKSGTCFLEASALPYKNWNNNAERLTWYKVDLSAEREHFVLLPSFWSRGFRASFRKNLQTILLVFRMKKRLPFFLLKQRNFPSYLQPYGGSQWWAVPVALVEDLFRFLDQHPGYISHFRWTLFADELFFHSVFMHLLQVRGEQPEDPITFADWERPDVPLPVTFTLADRELLLQLPEGFLFARKFDAELDAGILDAIDRQRLLEEGSLTSGSLHLDPAITGE
ncbi:MAG TPA: beta-1,6-N-acetylglucosaminyltransferase [Flavisolibacter sp.]|nr:beta-1,6-N-acetylglucosaminyltransferase [Flavisolibacter sp.]